MNLCCPIIIILKCLFGILASVMMSIGLIFLVIGFMCLWGMKMMVQRTAHIEKGTENFLITFQVKGDTEKVMALLLNNADLIATIALVIGVLLVSLALLMAVVTCCYSIQSMLWVMVLFSCAVVVLVILMIYYGVNQEQQIFWPMEDYIQKKIISKYVGLKDPSSESVAVNVIHILGECCGLNGYRDFDAAPNFKRDTILMNGTSVNMSFPISCCQFRRNFTISPVDENRCKSEQSSNRKDVGCWKYIRGHMRTYLQYTFIIVGSLVGCLVLCIILIVISIICGNVRILARRVQR